jgi:hypothetical protein
VAVLVEGSAILISRLRVGRPRNRSSIADIADQLFFLSVQSGSGAQPANNIKGTFVLYGVKRPVREADHLAQSSAKVMNKFRYTFILPYVFMALCLIKHR